MELNPLEGLVILDTSRLLPGGYCSMLLAELGAEVIKVEQPGRGDYIRDAPPFYGGRSVVNETVNKNKKSIAIDLKKKEGKKILQELVKNSDVFIEGFRPGVMERLGFGFGAVSTLNREIIYCSISSFGSRSKLSRLPGHDINFQAYCGLLNYCRKVPLIQLADISAGIFSCIAILSSLLSKHRPVRIDVPITHSLLYLSFIPLLSFIATGREPSQGQSLLFGSEPYYNIYKTRDSRYFAIGAIERKFWEKFLKLSSIKHGSVTRRELKNFFSSKNYDELIDICSEETCLSPVLTIGDVIRSEWINDYGLIRYVNGFPLIQMPSFFGRIKRQTREAPSVGTHTVEILSSIGYKKNEIDALLKKGVVS